MEELVRFHKVTFDYINGNIISYKPRIQSHAQVFDSNLQAKYGILASTYSYDCCSWVGIPLQIDQATIEKKYGYYAGILAEVDLFDPLPDTLSVELPNYCFPVEVHYKNLPAKCVGCLRFGLSITNCRHSKDKQVMESLQEKPRNKNL